MVTAAAGVDWVTVAPRSRRCSWSTPGSRSTTRGSTSATATTSPTRSSPSPSTRSTRGCMVMRGAKRKGVRYFGPYSHAWAIRETLDLLLRVFPARTCSAGVFKRHGQIGRPCLLGDIGKCSAPCVGRVDAERAPAHRGGLLRLHGRPHRPTWSAGSSGRCEAASDELEFERAARLRDDLAALRRAMEKQTVVLRRRHRRRRGRLRRGPARGRGAGVPRARRAGPRPARLGGGEDRGADHRRPGPPLLHPGLRRRGRGRGPEPTCRARSWCRSCRPTPTRWPTG